MGITLYLYYICEDYNHELTNYFTQLKINNLFSRLLPQCTLCGNLFHFAQQLKGNNFFSLLFCFLCQFQREQLSKFSFCIGFFIYGQISWMLPILIIQVMWDESASLSWAFLLPPVLTSVTSVGSPLIARRACLDTSNSGMNETETVPMWPVTRPLF